MLSRFTPVYGGLTLALDDALIHGVRSTPVYGGSTGMTLNPNRCQYRSTPVYGGSTAEEGIALGGQVGPPPCTGDQRTRCSAEGLPAVRSTPVYGGSTHPLAQAGLPVYRSTPVYGGSTPVFETVIPTKKRSTPVYGGSTDRRRCRERASSRSTPVYGGSTRLPEGVNPQKYRSTPVYGGSTNRQRLPDPLDQRSTPVYGGSTNSTRPQSLSAYWDMTLQRAEHFIASEQICPPALSGVTGKHLFGFEKMTPMQKRACRLAFSKGPHLFVMEDQTGSGKTEAALMLASRLMAAGQADGLYFGLPTQATSNQMYGRMIGKKNNVPVSRLLYTFEPWVSLQHSSASRLNPWVKGIKKNRKAWMLAPFSVGTIDQAVIGCLTIKHSTLRLVGLCSKVLVVDELHCYDEYTFYLIKTLVNIQTMLGGSTIVLSATLPRWVRTEICLAFQQGAGLPKATIQQDAYPLLTHVSPAGVVEKPVQKSSARTIPIQIVNDDDAIWQGLEAAHQKGWACCWIRNTVKEAQDAYDKACWKFGKNNVILLHARFTQHDRQKHENTVESEFGKESKHQVRKGKVLIATQVVEQSLDLDFDFLCTDICSIDLLLQRIGRFRRHKRDRLGNPRDRLGNPRSYRESRGRATVLVRAPVFQDNPKHDWLSSDMESTARVYRDSHAHIWATCRELQARSSIHLPSDCRPLLNAVFGQDDRLDDQTLPKGLYKRIKSSNCVRDSKETHAILNAIRPTMGYHTSGRWQDDDDLTRMLTRDISATVRLRLAKMNDQGEIEWLVGQSWEDSEVPCYEQQAASWRHIIDDERDPNAVVKLMGRFIKKDEILAIMRAHARVGGHKVKCQVAASVVAIPTGKGEWRGRTFCRLREGERVSVPSSRILLYSHTMGLMVP